MTAPVSIARVDHRANNFDFLRFVAASAVLYSHCFALTDRASSEPLVRLTHGQYVFGGLAVRVFFVISGYLVMQSWLRRPRVLVFASARCLRIFPGLALALAVSVVMGSVATTLPLAEYWTHPQTRQYFWHNLLLRMELFLPGAFGHNAALGTVNGSLWSLYYEVRAYSAVLGLGAAGLFQRRWLGVLAWVGAASLIVLWPTAWGVVAADHSSVVNAYACFIAAALVALLPEVERWLGWVALAAVVAVPIAFHLGGRDMAVDALLVSGTLWFGRRRLPGIAAFGRFGDFSYGIFLYAFPTQQLIAWLAGTREPYAMLALAFPAVLALAAVSWHLVERPSLALKRRVDVPRLDALRAAAVAWVLGVLGLHRAPAATSATTDVPSGALDAGARTPPRS
jgi:peptidoglycan/LPS O-acetylase OafA/YrhL